MPPSDLTAPVGGDPWSGHLVGTAVSQGVLWVAIALGYASSSTRV